MVDKEKIDGANLYLDALIQRYGQIDLVVNVKTVLSGTETDGQRVQAAINELGRLEVSERTKATAASESSGSAAIHRKAAEDLGIARKVIAEKLPS